VFLCGLQAHSRHGLVVSLELLTGHFGRRGLHVRRSGPETPPSSRRHAPTAQINGDRRAPRGTHGTQTVPSSCLPETKQSSTKGSAGAGLLQQHGEEVVVTRSSRHGEGRLSSPTKTRWWPALTPKQAAAAAATSAEGPVYSRHFATVPVHGCQR